MKAVINKDSAITIAKFLEWSDWLNLRVVCKEYKENIDIIISQLFHGFSQSPTSYSYVNSIFQNIQTLRPGFTTIESLKTYICAITRLTHVPPGITDYTLDGLDSLGKNESLCVFFDKLLEKIPAENLPQLPENTTERATVIRQWMKTNAPFLSQITTLNCIQLKKLCLLPPEIQLLNNLRSLILNYTNISSLENLNLPELNYLSLTNTNVSSLEKLHLPKLNILNLANTKVSSLKGINLSNVKWLNLERTPFSSLAGLDLSNVEQLYLDRSNLFLLDGLHLPNLQYCYRFA